MRANLLKLIGIMALSVATALVTSSILAQSRGGPRQGKPAARGMQVSAVTPTANTTITSARPLAAAAAVGGEAATPFTTTFDGEGVAPTAAFWLKHFDVLVQGQDVFVNAEAGMRDTRIGIVYFWSLRVTDGTNRDIVLNRRDYTDQMFAMPAEREMSPTFEERLRFGPGDYQVEISLFQVPAVTNLTRLQDREWAREHQVFCLARRFTISG